MNHLAHLLLADGDPELLFGALLADELKGRLEHVAIDPGIVAGVRLHRHIDAAADGHAAVRRFAAALPARFRRYAPLLADVFHDVLLAGDARRWQTESLPDFERRTLGGIADHPQAAQHPTVAERARRMLEQGLLRRYADPAILPRVLAHLSARLKRDNPLAQGAGLFHEHRALLEHGLETLMHDLTRTSGQMREQFGRPAPVRQRQNIGTIDR